MADARPPFYLGTEIDGVHLRAEQLHVRDTNLNAMLGRTSYTQALFHILRGRLPDRREEQLFDLVLVAFHGGFGLLPPTTLVPRLVAGTGVPVAQALAAGYLASGPYHVGAVEQSMTLYTDIASRFREGRTGDATAGKLEQFAFDCTAEMLRDGRTVPGLGHPLLRRDPRPTRIRRVLIEQDIEHPYLEIFDGVSRCLQQQKDIVPNVDGITAAILLMLGFTPEHGTGLFLLGRTAAMLAHVVEERKQMPYQTMKRFMILPIVFPRLFNSNSRRLAVWFNKLRDNRSFRRLQTLLFGRAWRDGRVTEEQDLEMIAAHREQSLKRSILAELDALQETPAAPRSSPDAPPQTAVAEDGESDGHPGAAGSAGHHDSDGDGLLSDLNDVRPPELMVGAACFLSTAIERLDGSTPAGTSGDTRDGACGSQRSRDLLESALKLVEEAASLSCEELERSAENLSPSETT